MIPKSMSKQHILKAIEEIDRNGVPKNREATKFILLYNGKFYPPKYVLSLANKYANGKELTTLEFGGGKETNDFLREKKFTILPNINDSEISSTPKVIIKGHNERCSECKNIIMDLLRKIYGTIKVDHKIEISVRIEDYLNQPYYNDLLKIKTALENYRGHRDFIKCNVLPRCDIFIPNPGCIVELDESQHFTGV